MNNVSLRLQDTSLQPFADQAHKGPVIDAQTQHLKQLVMVKMVEKALNVGVYHITIAPVLQVEGEVFDRIPRPAPGSIAVTAVQKVLLIDGSHQPRTRS